MDVSCIDIKSYIPLKKDIDRAENLSWCRGSYYGSGAPFHSEASKMAKLIKDPDKLIRRSIAVVMRWGTNDHIGYDVGVPKNENAWTPFRDRLYEMGFTGTQICELIEHAKDLDSKSRAECCASLAARYSKI